MVCAPSGSLPRAAHRAGESPPGGTLCTYEGVAEGMQENAALLADMVPSAVVEGALDAIRRGMADAMATFERQPFYLHVDLMRDAMRRAGAHLQHGLSEAEVERLLQGLESSVRHLVPRPGMRATLESLRARGLYLGGVSNSDKHQFEQMVGALGVADLFQDLPCSEEARSCKPDAAIFLLALQRAGCRPDEAVFVGDTPQHDMAGAAAVGMRTVLIEETTDLLIDRSVTTAEQVVIQELQELLDLV